MPKISHFSPVHRTPGTRNLELPEPETIASTILNGGMTLDFDPSDIPENKSPLVINARVRRDKTSIRNGQFQFLANRPDTKPVTAVISFKIAAKTTYFVRTTDSEVYFTSDISAGVWTLLTGNTLSGRLTDRAVVLGVLVLADGVGRLQEANLSDGTLADLGDIAPTAKYVTGFSERVVAANGGMSDEASETIYWSGNRNLSEFDALIDISAGNKRLDTSPRTEIDPISGIFGFSSVMVMPRESSIWVAQQQAIASDPFKTFRAVPGVGTNLPGSIAIGRELLMFIDSRMRDIVVYTPGSNVETIGIAVRNTIIKDIKNADSISSAYLTSEQEYYILIVEGNIVKIWCFNFLTQAWTFDEVPLASSIDIIDDFSTYTPFDDLTGTFDALTGTFDELSATPAEIPRLAYGFTNGDITKEDENRQLDFSQTNPAGVAYQFELRSKEFKTTKGDITVNRIEIEYQATVDGVGTLEFSKNGGISFTVAKTFTFKLGKVQILKFKKQVRSRRFMWRVLATDSKFDLLGYELDAIISGESRR